MKHLTAPALHYHKVTPRWEAGVTWVMPKAFYKQMERIASQGWQTLLPNERLDESIERKFYLFFDDGYECIYRHAFPILQDFSFKATVFIPSDFVGKTNNWDHQLLGRQFRHLNKRMLIELSEKGWIIGSHCATHRDLLSMTVDRLENEIIGSRETLMKLLGREIHWISFPFGRYDQHCIDIAVKAGYSGAIAPVLRSVSIPADFNLLISEAIYLWHSPKSILKFLENLSSPFEEIMRLLVNKLNSGTILWKRLFTQSSP